MKPDKNDYAAVISNASPLRLVVVNFELIIACITDANAAFASGNTEAFSGHLKHAREFLNVLMTSLDMSYDISKELMRIYIYINGLLIKADIEQNAEHSATAADMLGTLADSFKKIPEPDGGDAAETIKNARQIYAGLTYKDGKLTEYVEEDAERGFKA